jgi:predicted ester cyclase
MAIIGELMGSPATGKQVAFEVIDILQLTGGKITDHWVVVDQLVVSPARFLR